MRRTKKNEQTDFERLCQELGEEPIQRLYEAYRLTAAAILQRAQQQAESKMRKAKPNLPTMKPRVPSVKPKHNTKVKDLPKQKNMLEEFLLKRVIEEAKSFRRPGTPGR
jgi:hypothetical protein